MLPLEMLTVIAGATIVFLTACAFWNRKQGWRKHRPMDTTVVPVASSASVPAWEAEQDSLDIHVLERSNK